MVALAGVLALAGTAAEQPDTVMDASLTALRQSAGAGDPQAQFRLAALYETGFAPGAIPRDSLKALELYQAAALNGLPAAQNYYGYLLIAQGRVDEGLDMVERAARAGDPKACNNLGYLLVSGEVVERDYAKAAYWYERAAEAGLPVAMAGLADMARQGQGMPPDTLRAVALYDAALGAGFAGAQHPLITMMHGVWERLSPTDALALGDYYHTLRAPAVAVVLWSMAADTPADPTDTIATETRARARALLGEAYSRGTGVEYSHARSLNYYFLAAVDGNPSAQYVVAELLDMFPDALCELTDPQALAAVDERTSSATYWYGEAARGGVTTAEEAAARLWK